jgi:putative ABC transport system ATP-binding protein
VTQAITARGLEMLYGSGSSQVQALRGVDLDAKLGEIVVVMGPSGSGKTTLLSVLSGILRPTKGTAQIFGSDITAMTRPQLAAFRRDHFGFIFQGFNLFGALTARQNVEVALELKDISGRNARAEADRMLASAGIAHRAGHVPRDLSGGEKQRVSIARALAGGPKVVVADEPTASLDSANGHAVVELLRKLAKEKGSTVLIVTHDARIADVADRVLHLIDGALVERSG